MDPSRIRQGCCQQCIMWGLVVKLDGWTLGTLDGRYPTHFCLRPLSSGLADLRVDPIEFNTAANELNNRINIPF